MALDFPASPAPGDEYVSGDQVWRFDGVGWMNVTPIDATDISGLAAVATSGDYDDLSDRPTIPDSPDDIGAAAVNHNHDSDYATLEHNHDFTYAALNHNHDSDYAALNHNHDSDYAALNHNHDSDYAALNHNHDSDYAAADEAVVVYVWDGNSYEKVATSPRVFIGPNDPAGYGFTLANGDQWEDTGV